MSEATEQEVRMTAQLYEMRDRAKRFLGDRYKAHMAEIGKILTQTAERDGKDVLEAAIDVCKKRECVAIDLMMILAAAVELVEPSP